MAGENVTYVDFVMFELCDLMNWLTNGDIYNHYPNLKQYFDRVANLPRLKEFFEDDARCIKRPFNNKVARINN